MSTEPSALMTSETSNVTFAGWTPVQLSGGRRKAGLSERTEPSAAEVTTARRT
jgi:hypothetical protein